MCASLSIKLFHLWLMSTVNSLRLCVQKLELESVILLKGIIHISFNYNVKVVPVK